MVRREWYFSPSQGIMFRYIWDLKKMRIFKNKIIFLVFFLRPVRPGGIIEVPQISRIYTDFFFYYILSADETYSVRLRRFSRLHCSPLRKRFVLKSSRPSLPLKKAPPLISVFSPQGRRGKPPYSVLEPLRYKVGGPSEVSPDFAGWDRQGWNGDMRLFVA